MITGPLAGVSGVAPFHAAMFSWTEMFPQPVGTFTVAVGGSVISGPGAELEVLEAAGGAVV